jgi:heme-degrading monooxygenase HmoA
MVWTSGIWTVKPGREDEFVAAWTEFAEWSLLEFPASWEWLLRRRDQPHVFMSAGPWPSEEIVGRWRGSAGFQERIGRVREMLDDFEPRTFDEVAAIA